MGLDRVLQWVCFVLMLVAFWLMVRHYAGWGWL